MQGAREWGEEFLSSYFGQFAAIPQPEVSNYSANINGIITGLIIASYAERFTNEMLENDFGYSPGSILDIALKIREIAL
jgi:hypothetical protein